MSLLEKTIAAIPEPNLAAAREAQARLDQIRLGEGTGVTLAMHLVEASVRILREMATFTSAGVSGKS